ncbi:ABC transporter ATP-binding protein [Nocardioides zeae]|uniref:ABC transporter ATP-binding protein n=1 Tax=Nocardioides imazamoxiresistens TaxID=3231893 RepID=A0ABU3PWM5_9ACTN|nr:ABC transporter ATP-binding protein [Nocardioides zeae]MDT9593643.1 ABC transporter ATP-binding protein [Nocardioides zeae]
MTTTAPRTEARGVEVRVGGVSRSFGPVEALAPTDVVLAPGSFTALVGPSGCGKSTLLDVIAGLQTPTGGQVALDGAALSGPRRETGIIFQEAAVLPWRTVLDNAAFALEVQGVGKAERREVARETLRKVGLSGFADAYPHQLSGGMRQRTAIARVLSTQPDLILADEPFGALDEQTRTVLGLELLRVAREAGTTVLFVTHSISEAVLLSDRVLVMSARPGRIIDDFEVALPAERTPDLLGAPEAAGLVERVWQQIRGEAERAMAQQATS